MTKNSNLFLIIALILVYSHPLLELQRQFLKSATVGHKSQHVQLIKLIQNVFFSVNSLLHNFHQNHSPSTPIKVLKPRFTVNVPLGGSSPIQLDVYDIALQSDLDSGVKNVLDAWFRISDPSTFLCSALIAPS
ncbi:6086_t:CDS:2 [Ambispora gerdemannii]|uniref:6086_t:CDS:1 n=1 Tax=Ambispora gerdemannii TaxID=144530 RepID=A0A9N9FA02_9GLOM|nr:6086_t:CDS:2 [Ambispora gerdemannii]